MYTKPHFDFKVVVAGPFAAGKTTMIAASADGPLVATEAPTSGEEASVKALTTVGMEYGTLRREADAFSVELRLFGVPGQERFSFMWDIVSVGMDGLFLIVDASRPETWATSKAIGDHFMRAANRPVVVGVNEREPQPDILDKVQQAVILDNARYVSFDVTDREQAQDALIELLLGVLEFEQSAAQGVAVA